MISGYGNYHLYSATLPDLILHVSSCLEFNSLHNHLYSRPSKFRSPFSIRTDVLDLFHFTAVRSSSLLLSCSLLMNSEPPSIAPAHHKLHFSATATLLQTPTVSLSTFRAVFSSSEPIAPVVSYPLPPAAIIGINDPLLHSCLTLSTVVSFSTPITQSSLKGLQHEL